MSLISSPLSSSIPVPAAALPTGQAEDPIERARAFRAAMAQVAAAVHVVTTDGPCGRAGFTASAVSSLSDAPPMLLVCLQKNSSAYAAVRGNGVLCVNTLSADQEDLSRLFGGKTPMAERFAGLACEAGASGSPLLPGVRARFDCHIEQVVSVATHDVLLCRVVAQQACAPAAGSLVYADRRYHGVGGEETACSR